MTYDSSVDKIAQFGLEQQLCLFARDEVMTWLHGRGQPWTFDISFRTNCAANIDGVVKRAEVMACKLERDQVRQSCIVRILIYWFTCYQCNRLAWFQLHQLFR
jgi:hypothetical protein